MSLIVGINRDADGSSQSASVYDSYVDLSIVNFKIMWPYFELQYWLQQTHEYNVVYNEFLSIVLFSRYELLIFSYYIYIRLKISIVSLLIFDDKTLQLIYFIKLYEHKIQDS